MLSPSDQRRIAVTTFVITFVVALIPRLAFSVLWPSGGGDTPQYERVAENILQHGCVSLSDPATGVCAPHWGGNQLPGYPAFIAGVWMLLGHSELMIRIAQSVLGSVAIAYLAVTIIGYASSSPWRLLAIGMVALSPLTIPQPRFILTEALSLAVAHWILAEIILSFQANRLRSTPLGVAFAIAMFLRYDNVFLCIPISISAFVLHGLWSGLRRAAVVTLIAIMPLSAWWARSMAAGLPYFPDSWTMPDNTEPPKGYLAWGCGWIIHEYDNPGWLYPAYHHSYSRIQIPASIYDSKAEQTQVEALLHSLSDYDGKPFPRDIDNAFAEISATRLRTHPLRQLLVRPFLRGAWLWLSPVNSNGWPVMLDVPTLTQQRDYSRLIALAQLRLDAVFIKGATSLYRIVLLLASIGLFIKAIVRRNQRPGPLLVLALVYAGSQTIFHAVMSLVEPRYMLSAVVFLETALALELGRFWLDRPTAQE